MRILHVEDNDHDAELIRIVIMAEWPGCRIDCVDGRDPFTNALRCGKYDLILSDFALPGFDGFEVLKLAKASAPDAPFIFISGTIGEDRAIEAVRLGADDYVLKDRMKRLVTAMARAFREAGERTQRRRAEERIRELGECLNQAREAVIVTDLDHCVTFWNQGAERLAGWSAADAFDRRIDELFDASTAERLIGGCRSASNAGEWAGEVEVRDRVGVSRTVELRVSETRDNSGKPKAWLVLATDVTARCVAERRVREQADMLNQAGEAIFIADLANRILYWNAGAERMLAWSADAVIGRAIEDTMPADLLPAIETARAETLRNGRWCGELELRNANGEPLIVESRQTLVRDEHGRPKARLCINADITEKKNLEEQFLRAQRMENLGLLAAGIAHDLNNTLAPILLATPMLRDHVADPFALNLLDTLEKSGERGALLVRQILSFAHGVSGEHQLLQVKHLLRDIADIIDGTFPKSIRLEDYVPSDLWPIKGNPTQVHQVLLNLCVNARDAMPGGGILHLRGENLLLDEIAAAAVPGGRTGAFLVLHVSDTGTGIAPEILRRIWEPFFTTKDAGRGTGLGLSTVRGIVEAHQGFVDVRSKLGEGTCFRVYLPAADVAIPDGGPMELRTVARGNGELILVADDEEQIREMTSVALRRYGYRVILASDGVEAAALFAQRAAEIRLVISDLHMPNLDGAMLARALRQINTTTKLLVVSGMASGLGDRLEYQPDEFADAVLLKPFKPETLLESVHRLLNPSDELPATVRPAI